VTRLSFLEIKFGISLRQLLKGKAFKNRVVFITNDMVFRSMFCPFSLMKKGGKINAVNRCAKPFQHRLKNQNSGLCPQSSHSRARLTQKLIFLDSSAGNVLNAICSRPTQTPRLLIKY
jgi:hypothetical protein